MNENLFDRVFRDADPSRLLIETSEGRKISYGDTIALSGQFANALTARGVAPGDRVAVQTDKTPEILIFYLACLRAGAVYLPLNTAYTLAELDYFIGDAEPKLVVSTPEKQAGLADIAARVGAAVETMDASGNGSLTDLAASQPSDFATVERQGSDLAAILYTSGTTGRSKGAMLTHDNLVSNALALVETWHFTGDDVLLHALPIYHTHGLFVATNTVLFSRASMLFLPKFDADAVMALLPRASVLMGVPTFYTRLVKHPGLSRQTAAHMRLFVSGSAPLLAETHRDFETLTGHAILERYGMTETNMNTSNPYDGDRIAGTVGFPLPGTSIRIADPETGEDLPQGKIGVIEVKGPNVFKGYWRMPDKTETEFRPDGFFITGDMGTIDERGYISIVGRAKDLIISGGFNVYPKEVEGEIDDLPGVVESAVVGVPHPDLGEGVVAVVVAQSPDATDGPRILDALKDRLARFKMPRHIALAEELPRNTMGKVQKNVLRDQFAKVFAPEND